MNDLMDPVSSKARTRTPSRKQSTNGWSISHKSVVLTMGWSLLPPEFGPSLRSLKETDKHEQSVPVDHMMSKLEAAEVHWFDGVGSNYEQNGQF